MNEVMPSGFQLTADNGRLQLHIEGSWASTLFAAEIVEDETQELAERLQTAVYAVINSVQDSVSKHLRTAWPSTDGRKMALPGVRLGTDSIHLWYGEFEKSPVLGIPEIPLAEIASTRDTAGRRE
jgi:hypothetical protein